LNGQSDVAYLILAAAAGTIVSLYILFHRSRAVTIGILGIVGWIVGLGFAQPARYRKELFIVNSRTLTGAALGAAMGVLVSLAVIRSWRPQAPRKTAD
jgi:hypothetical protein